MLAALGRWTAKHRWWMLLAWTVLILSGAVFGGAVFDHTQPVDASRSHTESSLAQKRLDELSPEGESILAVVTGRHFNSAGLINNASRVMFDIRAVPGVAEVVDPYTSGAASVSADNQTFFIRIELRPDLTEEQALAVADQVTAMLHRIDAPQVLVGGKLLAERTFADQATSDAVFGESLALIVVGGLLIVILGGIIVGSLPLAAAVATITTSLLSMTALAATIMISDFAVNVATLLGIGLAVDYGLLLVVRFRDERACDPGAPVADLLARTMATAGRAVLVSGLAVGAALAALLVFADPLLASMALGGALAVGHATIAGLTFVPALIAVAHRRIPAPATGTWISRRKRPNRTALLARLAAGAQRRPLRTALGVTAALFMLGAPALHLTLADSDARSLPAGSQERRVYETLEREFPSLTEEPITVLIEARSAEPAVRALLTDLVTLANVKEIYQRSGLPHGVTVVDITADDHTSAQQAEQLVRTIRTIPADVPMLVAGPTAQLLDAKDSTARHLPAAISLIAVSTALLLFALTGSVVIPVKALLMNALTLTATLGILVAIFQWGWGDHLLGFQAWGALDLTTPLLLFVFIFGLSMDYEVFLLARVKEAWDRRERPAGDSGTRDPSDQAFTDRAASDRAVLEGISATGPVVTTAALSIGVVFLGFALGDLVAVKEIGVGMTVAVLLDVTVVRGLLLPAAMSLLGARNWWPGWRRGKAAARTVDQDAERPLAAT